MSKKHAKKKQEEYEQEQAARIKMLLQKLQKYYLVGITGRTSFILQNMHGVKFKSTIGNQLKCSCNPAYNNNFYLPLSSNFSNNNNSLTSSGVSLQCNHTLYALTEIFYLPADHPLIYKNLYTDKELRYIIANRRIHDNKVTGFLKYVKDVNLKMSSIRKNIILEEDDEDDDDNLCAICHTQIVKNDAITSCTTVCRNTFHLECFAQWANHQIKNNGVVKCPLCRDQKSSSIIKQIRLKVVQHKEQQITKKIVNKCKQYNYYCDGCQLKEIQSGQMVYKCVNCQDVTLCQSCFKGGKHMKHSFICKYTNNVNQQKWRECQDRKLKKKQDLQQGLIKIKLKTYKRLYNFLASTLPCYFSKNTRWNIIQCKKLDIKIQELECMMCNDKSKAFLRRLQCGHFIHHKCLRKRIEKGRFYCKQDGQKYLTGYESILKHQELNKKAQIQQKSECSESEEEEKQERKSRSPDRSIRSPGRRDKSMKNLRSCQKSTTSCDSRKKGKGKNRLGGQDRNKSLTSKFMLLNPQ